MNESLQLCQCTIAASRGRPVMERRMQDVVDALHVATGKQNTSIANINLDDHEII